MASDKIQLDADGKRILADDGQQVLADTGDDCDCSCGDCTCDVVDLGSYAAAVTLGGGCPAELSDCRDEGGGEEDWRDAADTIYNGDSIPGFSECNYTSAATCKDTGDIQTIVQIVDDATLGCIWRATVTWNEIAADPDVLHDVFTGYRTKAAGIVGAYTKISGCATGFTVS